MIEYYKNNKVNPILSDIIVGLMNFNYRVLSKIFSIKTKKHFFYITLLCYCLLFIEEFMIPYYFLFSHGTIKDNIFYILLFFWFSLIFMHYDNYPKWIDNKQEQTTLSDSKNLSQSENDKQA